jgi:Ala-tRNA(Pro) deacylase
MLTKNDVFNVLTKLAISHTTYDHTPFFTVQDSVEGSKDWPPFGKIKNLFLKDKNKQMWLLVAMFDTKVNLKELDPVLGTKGLHMAQEDALQNYLGVGRGAVSAFGLLNDTGHAVNVVLEDKLFTYDKVGLHPLTNTATTFITPKDLTKFIEHCQNNYRTIAIDHHE